MKALSLSQPWCWSIFDPIADKDIENRSWPPPRSMIDETIAIHAAKSWDENAVPYFMKLGITHFPARRDLYTVSAIVGVATIAGVVTSETIASAPNVHVHWFFGPYGWLWPNRRALPKPIPCAGKQGLWNMSPVIEEQIRDQLGMA